MGATRASPPERGAFKWVLREPAPLKGGPLNGRFASQPPWRGAFKTISPSFPMHFLQPQTRFLAQVVILTLCLCTLGTSAGCLRKRMTIQSNPPGATVYVDGHQLGKTPVSTDFTYYGTRNIRLEMDNYQTLNVKQKVKPAWYEIPPLDFFTETFSAGEIKDQHVYNYDLQQRAISSDEQIMERAKDFAFEGSRSVNADGSLGTPVTSENYHAPSVGENPDAGLLRPAPVTTPATAPVTEAVPAPETSPLTQPVPERDPNRMPTGSADWDSPNRY